MGILNYVALVLLGLFENWKMITIHLIARFLEDV